MSDYNPNTPPKKRPFSMQLDVAQFEPATEEEKAQVEIKWPEAAPAEEEKEEPDPEDVSET